MTDVELVPTTFPDSDLVFDATRGRGALYMETLRAVDRTALQKALEVIQISFLKEFRRRTVISIGIVAIGLFVIFATPQFIEMSDANDQPPAEVVNGDEFTDPGQISDESGEVPTDANAQIDGVIIQGVGGTPEDLVNNVSYYTVQQSDNLFRIALRFGVNQDVLAQVNGIVDQNVIYIGQVLTIPSSFSASAVNTERSPVGVNPEGPVGNVGHYVVQEGDNLFRIALNYGYDLQVLAAYNGVQLSPDSSYALIHVGDVIYFPAK